MIYLMLGRRGKIYAVSGTKNILGDTMHSSPNTVTLNQGITVGVPPYYKLTGTSGEELVLEELPVGSPEYRKVEKWVGVYNHGEEATRRTVVRRYQRPSIGQNGVRLECVEVRLEGVSSRLLLNNKPGLTEEQVRQMLVETALRS